MKNSKLPLLDSINKIVLCAGHGLKDPGSTHGPYREYDRNVYIVRKIAEMLIAKGIDVKTVPPTANSGASVEWMKKHYPGVYDAWSIQIHTDSAEGITEPRASKECGVYYGTTVESQTIAIYVAKKLKDYGANSTTWARPDTASRHKRLAWIRGVPTVSHLMELGFIQGDNSHQHYDWLASIASMAIYRAFIGSELSTTNMNEDVTNQLKEAIEGKNAAEQKVAGLEKELGDVNQKSAMNELRVLQLQGDKQNLEIDLDKIKSERDSLKEQNLILQNQVNGNIDQISTINIIKILWQSIKNKFKR